MELNPSYSRDSIEKLTISLKKILSSTYVLYLKTQNFHWNIESVHFISYHRMFQEQYEELAEAIDEIAERIRVFGVRAPGTMQEFLQLSLICENTVELSAKAMIEELYRDHKRISEILYANIKEAQDNGDEGTADLYIQRLRVHEKTCWMLKSHLIVEELAR